MNEGGVPADEPESAEAPHPTSAHEGERTAEAADGASAGAGRPEEQDLQAVADDLRERLGHAEDLRLRALADLDNVRKRCAAQVERAATDARGAVAALWLPVVDNLDRALLHAAAEPDAIIEGVRAVREQALGVLASLGFPRRDDSGAMFDPSRHEAIATRADPTVPPGTVLELVRARYGDGPDQLRPAQVVVAKAD